MTERYNGATRLRRLHGMRGYGIYCRIVELCASAPGKKLRYDLDDLVYDMREKRELVKEIVENYGLFVIEGEFVEDVYARSPEALERERQEQIRARRSTAAKKAAQTRRERREAAKKTADETPSLIVEPATASEEQPRDDAKDNNEAEPEDVDQNTLASTTAAHNNVAPTRHEPAARILSPDLEPGAQYQASESHAPIKPLEPGANENVSSPPIEPNSRFDRALSERFDRIKDSWNRTFRGTRRMVHYWIPDQMTWRNFTESAAFYTDEDFLDAFKQAQKDKKFTWQFRDVVKPTNMQRLLSEVEAKKLREKEEEEELDPATKEMIEYGRKMGWDWTETASE